MLLVEHAADVEEITGWGLYCGAEHHEDSLRANLQEGQFATRTASGQPWVIEALQSRVVSRDAEAPGRLAVSQLAWSLPPGTRLRRSR